MIEGIDVSWVQKGVNYETVKGADKKFVIIKATDGWRGQDPRFPWHLKNARPHLWMGAYHVLRCNHDIAAQAKNFYLNSKGLGEMRMQLPPAVDWELFGPDGAVPRSQLVPRALEMLKRVEDLFSCTPMLYTYPWFLQTALDAAKGDYSELGRFPLWYANYKAKPKPPAPWSKITIQQYAGDNGKCHGVPGACDLNRFLGSETDLRKFMGDPGPFPDEPVDDIE